MKMGEIRSCPDGTFIMQTPDGVRDVTLRCTHKGEVHVEEVSGGGISTKVLMIHNWHRREPSLSEQTSSRRL